MDSGEDRYEASAARFEERPATAARSRPNGGPFFSSMKAAMRSSRTDAAEGPASAARSAYVRRAYSMFSLRRIFPFFFFFPLRESARGIFSASGAKISP